MLLRLRRMMESGEGPVRIVCFGDSITGVYYHTGGRRAWCDMLAIALRTIYPNAHLDMRNAGVSGNTTASGLARIERDVLAHKPDLVAVMFGMNDCPGGNLSLFRENLKTIAQRCRDAGAEVILCTPNSIYGGDKGRPPERLAAYADVVRAVAAETACPLADCHRAFEQPRESDSMAWRLLMSDTIHPGMNGQKLIAEVIAHAITGERVGLAEILLLHHLLVLPFNGLQLGSLSALLQCRPTTNACPGPSAPSIRRRSLMSRPGPSATAPLRPLSIGPKPYGA